MNRYRLVYIGLALALAAVVAATWALSTEGDDRQLPAVIELVSPAPDATVLRQASIVVDITAGYSLQLSIDGIAVPDDELRASDALGRYEWEPGPGKLFEEWSPGRHQVSISWDALTGLPDIGSFSWEFRIQ